MQSNDGPSPTPADLRREPRVANLKPLRIKPVTAADKDLPLPAELIDCSPCGIGLRCPVALAAGDQFTIKVRLKKRALLIYTVRHCAPAEDGQYKVGAEFTGLASSAIDANKQLIFEALLKKD